jgi:hypothetical protein
MVMSNTDANTLLHMYQMHVLDTDQVRLGFNFGEYSS